MDVKRQYFDCVIKKVEEAYDRQADTLKDIAAAFGSCMDHLGVVQLFGVRHGEEFVNELNYRAGGIAPFHALRLRDLVLMEKISQSDVDDGSIYEDISVADRFNEAYELDDRDMLCLVSFYGNEPLVIELARRAKEKGQKVVGVVNKKSYDKVKGTLLDYCDLWLDMGSEEPDLALDVHGVKTGQVSSTVSNVMAQMLTAEMYKYFIDQGKEAPILLSANVKGADVHNDSLTDPYGRRVR
ncbi:MAG: sugar isomerase domain-containing protein [Erysipelotrichaceae bacterium]|nr:sugar isomerase domain-containing protein [Erysipelotrichaceae bacterium]